MNVYESFAAALVTDYGRRVFLDQHGSSPVNFWSALIFAYGEDVLTWPVKLGLPAPARGYQYGSITGAQALNRGLDPIKFLRWSDLITGIQHQHSPIHIATALLKYCPAEREQALQLLQPKFLMEIHNLEATSHVSHCYPNPYGPADFGLERFRAKDFQREQHVYLVDEPGNWGWFETAYLDHITRTVSPEVWYSRMRTMSALFPEHFTPLVQRGALKMLGRLQSRASSSYRAATEQVAAADPREVRRFLQGETGTAALLWAALPDATPKEIAQGLRVLATGSSAPVRGAYAYIARQLTMEDIRELTPKQALEVVKNAPYEVVAELFRTSSDELGAYFFALTHTHLHAVSTCMTPHGRPKWVPATAANAESAREKWETEKSAQIARWVEAKRWRTALLDAAEPAVVFLAALRLWGHPTEIPVVAIDNVLRSHPANETVQSLIAHAPLHLQPKES